MFRISTFIIFSITARRWSPGQLRPLKEIWSSTLRWTFFKVLYFIPIHLYIEEKKTTDEDLKYFTPMLWQSLHAMEGHVMIKFLPTILNQLVRVLTTTSYEDVAVNTTRWERKTENITKKIKNHHETVKSLSWIQRVPKHVYTYKRRRNLY